MAMSARVIVEEIQLSADDQRVEYIMVRTEDGNQLTLRLGDEINPLAWTPQHLQSHVGLGKSLGFTIGVKYIETNEGQVATQLSE